MARHGHLAPFSRDAALQYIERHQRRILASNSYTHGHALAAAGWLFTRFGRRILSGLAVGSHTKSPGTRFWNILAGNKAAGARATRRLVPEGAEGIFTLSGALGLSGRIEVTAQASSILLRQTNRNRLVRQAIQFLPDNRSANGSWHTTQATTLALQALDAARRFFGRQSHGALSVILDGKQDGGIDPVA